MCTLKVSQKPNVLNLHGSIFDPRPPRSFQGGGAKKNSVYARESRVRPFSYFKIKNSFILQIEL